MTKRDIKSIEKFKNLVVSFELFKTEDRLVFRADQVFAGVELQHKTLLEIGCGDGVYSIWAKLNGANSVIGLEPEAKGSSAGSGQKFNSFIWKLKLDGIKCLPETIESFNPNGKKFDIVLSYSSINHLDEYACMELERDLNAQEKYLKIFKKIKSMMRPNGKLIILDNSNKNFFGLFGKRSPFAPDINWKKHQPPEVWIQLLKKSGFANPKVSWCARYKFLSGLLNKKAFAYFFNSFFSLEVSLSRKKT